MTLFYYPMFHVSDPKVVEAARKIILPILDEVSASKETREIINMGLSFEAFQKVWEGFTEYIKCQKPFDCLYQETWGFETRPRNDEGSEMKRCIDYILSSGAQPRIAESDFWYEMAKACGGGDYLLSKFINNRRENAVVRNIRKTLSPNERGLLLFGAGHKESLTRKLAYAKIHVKIIGEPPLDSGDLHF